MIRHFFICTGCFFLLIFTSVADAQNRDASFALIVFGQQLNKSSLEVHLKENPGLESSWQKLSDAKMMKKDDFALLMFNDLSVATFAGQDIRERYIEIKIENSGTNNTSKIRALYALPNLDTIDKHASQLYSAIVFHPEKLRRYSLGSLPFPRAESISPNKTWVEHIEMPVRHLKPGVQEVKWLDVIFSDN